MKPDVLEQNVARLLATSWRPVAPTPEFAARMRERLEREIRAGTGSRSRFARISPRLRIAASILLMLAGMATAWFLRRGEHATTNAEEIVGRGSVAVRVDGDWRAATDLEVAQGLDAGALAAAAATPDATEFSLHLGSAGRVEIGPRSTATVDGEGADRARGIEVAGERATVQRDDTGAPWIVRTPDGSIALERGVLAWTRAADGPNGAASYVELRVGRAWIAGDPLALLALGQRAWIADGRVVAAAAGIPDEPERIPARRTADHETTRIVDEPAVSEFANVSGTLVFPAGIEPPPSFRLTLLRRVPLPDVSEPETTVFAGRTRGFALQNVKSGTYDVFVEAAGHAFARRLGVEVGAERATELTFELQLARRVTGFVRDAETGAPIAGAAVLSETDLPAQVVPFDVDVESAGWLCATRTDEQGAFTLVGLDGGEHEIRVSARGRAARWIRARSGDDPVDVGTVDLRAGGTVHGRVSRSDGSAWPRAIVIASRMGSGVLGERMSYASVQSDSDGSYSISDLPPGGYVVFAFDPAVGGTPATRELTIRGAEVVEKDIGPTDRRTRVVGIVRDSAGAPLADVDLMLGHDSANSASSTTWISTRTAADGSYAIEGVDPRSYTLFVGRGLGTSLSIVGTLDVPLAAEIRHDVTLRGGSIQGRVLGIDGAPARGAWVIFLRGPKDDFAGRARADAAGRFDAIGLEPDVYAITAHDLRPGTAAVRVDGIDVAASPRDVTVTLVPGVELRVRVTDASGAPRSGVPVRFTDEAGVAWQFSVEDVTRANGQLDVPGVRPGRWRVAVDGAREQVIDLELGPRRDLEFRTNDDFKGERR